MHRRYGESMIGLLLERDDASEGEGSSRVAGGYLGWHGRCICPMKTHQQLLLKPITIHREGST